MSTTITLGLPLPVNVATDLLALISQRWPEAKALASSIGQMRIDLGDLTVTPEQPLSLDETPPSGVDLLEFDGAGLAMSLPLQLSTVVVALSKDLLDQTNAPNYVVLKVADQNSGGHYEITVRRPNAQTPAQQNEELCARVATLEADLAKYSSQSPSLTPASSLPSIAAMSDDERISYLAKFGIELELGDLYGPAGNAWAVYANLRRTICESEIDVPEADLRLLYGSFVGRCRNTPYRKMLDLVRDTFTWIDDETLYDSRFTERYE